MLSPADPRHRLLRAAYRIAQYAPKQPGRYAAEARVSWSQIREIREALAELGISTEHWDTASELERLFTAFEGTHE